MENLKILDWLVEYWLPVKGHNYYEVSNWGRVRSIDKYLKQPYGGFRFQKGKILNPYIQKSRKDIRKRVELDGVKLLVNRLVAEAFLPNPNNYPVVNHKDCNPSNNCVWNLEWCSYYYNNHYADASIKRSESSKKNVKKCPVVLCDKNGTVINYYNSVKEAELLTGVANSSICKCLNGTIDILKRGNAKNCYFRYA